MSLPLPPQCCETSFCRNDALPLMKTVALPALALHMLAPQHTACIPTSSTRSAGRPLTLTFGDPLIDGPTAG
jgi:hypothetical protein